MLGASRALRAGFFLARKKSPGASVLAGHPLALAPVDGVLAHPVAQGGVVDAKVAGDVGDGAAAGADQLNRVALELGGELATSPWWLGLSLLLLVHADILPSSEVSCPWGEAHVAG